LIVLLRENKEAIGWTLGNICQAVPRASKTFKLDLTRSS